VKTSNETVTVDGRLGLGRHGSNYDGDYYIDKLHAAGIISEKTFSISYDLATRSSFIDFGPADSSQMKANTAVVLIPMLGTANSLWQNQVDGFYFSSNTQKYTTLPVYGVVDSAASTLAGPQKTIDFMMTYITRYTLVTKLNGRSYFSCSTFSSVFPSIFLRFGSYWIEV